MTTSLSAVAAYVPPTSVPIDDLGEVLGLSPREIRLYRRFFGLRHVRLDPDAQLSDLLVAAAKGLGTLAGCAHQVRYVIHARTVHPTGPYSVNPLRDAQRTLGLEHAVGFAVTQHACASGLLAVDLAGRLLADTGDPDALALVLTGEKTYPHVTRLMPVPTVMGEAAAACLVGHGGARDRLLSYATRTHGRYYAATAMSPELREQFQREYPEALAEVIRSAVSRAGIGLADVDLILPHNVNRISWARLAHLLDYPVERIFLDNVPVTGHCFCADPFVNYACVRERGLLRRGDRYLMVSVGLGATFSAMLFRH
jgi:3-oxoacyl-[acyl-carrier-protein] synthase-3